MKKSKYIYEHFINGKILLISLLTFQYKVLNNKDTCAWISGERLSDNLKKELVELKILQEKDSDSDLTKYIQRIFGNKGNLNPNHVIFVTDECNQRCPYCFEEEAYLKPSSLSNTLTEEKIDSILKTITTINSKSKADGTITLFGGEPLLLKNKDIVEYILCEASKEEIPKMDIVTNGITMKNYIEIFNKYEDQLGTLIVTLNGYGDMHDLVRGSINNPSFDLIIESIKKVLENTKNINIRINILLNKNNVLSIAELLEYLKSQKISTNEKVKLIFGRIQFRTNPESNNYINELKYEDYYKHIFSEYYNNILVEDDMLSGSEVSILSKMYKYWKNGEIVYPQIKGCSAVYPGRFCYHPNGDIYPCTEVTGISKYKIGSYITETIDFERYGEWKNFKVTELEKCKKCKYIYLCNGGCPVTNISINGDIENVYCLNIEESLKKFIDILYKKGFFNEKQKI